VTHTAARVRAQLMSFIEYPSDQDE
jgi:hypothetical protein